MLANILAVGLMASVMSFSPKYVVDNQNDTITFSAEELNYTYASLGTALQNLDATNLPSTFTNASLTYNNVDYMYDSAEEDRYLFYDITNNYNIAFNFNGTITLFDNEWVEQNWTQSLTISDAQWFIANIEEPPSLTLSKYDLNNKKYTYLAEQLSTLQNNTEIENTSITYNGNNYTFDELDGSGTLQYFNETNSLYIQFYFNDEEPTTYGKWISTDGENDAPFTSSMTINNAQWFLDNINAPLDSEDMMTAITSGLPLMASLAQAFLNGFTSIFWNSTTSSLTTFSMFALIMLSVAIVFACIKLVLNVVRSNTGV